MPSVLPFLAGALLLAWPAAAGAASLAVALDAAWARQPQAAAWAARSDEAAARAALAAAPTAGPPSLAFGHLGPGPGHDGGRREWEIELAAPLWLPGQQAARQNEAARDADALAAAQRTLRLQLAGAVREAGWAVIDARAALDLAQQRATSARALEAEVERRHAAGELARIHANQAQGERLAAQSAVLDAASTLRAAEQHWRALTGLPAPLALDTEHVAEASDAGHPQLAAATAALDAAQARLRVRRVSRRAPPELGVRLVREREAGAEPWSDLLGVQLRLPLSAGAQRRADTAAAQAELAAAAATLEQARAAHTLDVERARAELATAAERDAASAQREDLAAESLRLAEKAFALGEADLATLLRLRASAQEAAADHARQIVARAAAVSRLNQALGVLP